MKRRLKIGIFMDSYYPAVDGVILVIDNLAKMLSKENDVVVVVPKTASISEDVNRPYKVIRIDTFMKLNQYNVAKIQGKHSKSFKKLVNEKFDVIHIHSPFTVGGLGIKVAKALNIPCIGTFHTRFDFEIRKIINSKVVEKITIKKIIKMFHDCDRCISINNAVTDVFKDYGYKKEPVVIYNGTDLKPCDNKKELVKLVNDKYNLKKDDNLLLFVGRITSVKNIFFIMDVLKRLKEKNFSYKMIFVGDGPDDKKLKNKINEYNLNDRVIMTGKIMDRSLLSAIYTRADLLLFPSLFDASSLVQIEAAVNETPGLFIENSVTSDTVENNVSGFKCKLDLETYADKIIDIFSNRKFLKEVAQNAKNMLGKSWEKIAEETYNLYLEEIDKKGKK